MSWEISSFPSVSKKKDYSGVRAAPAGVARPRDAFTLRNYACAASLKPLTMADERTECTRLTSRALFKNYFVCCKLNMRELPCRCFFEVIFGIHAAFLKMSGNASITIDSRKSVKQRSHSRSDLKTLTVFSRGIPCLGLALSYIVFSSSRSCTFFLLAFSR